MTSLQRYAKIRAAIARYKQRHHEQMQHDEGGGLSYADAALISACADEILTHLKLR